MEPLLDITSLDVTFATHGGPMPAVRRVALQVMPGSIVGLVGESGSGKSTVAAAVMGLLPSAARIASGAISFRGRDLARLAPAEMQALRGRQIAMIFQDPMTSLHPIVPIGRQMADIQYRDPTTMRERRARAAAMLSRVGLPDAARQLDRYPNEFSGGMRQRIAIAMALLQKPGLLIADEPTTALDVTMEAQIVGLLRRLQDEDGGSILFISHNLGLIAEICDRVVVMYAGEIVEAAPVRALFHRPAHPYTRALIECDPANLRVVTRRLPTIPGGLPDLLDLPRGCIFAPRCPIAVARCRMDRPALRAVGPDQVAACHLAEKGEA